MSESYLDEEQTLTVREDIRHIDRALDDQPLQVPSFEECADISKTDRAVDDQPLHVPSSEECDPSNKGGTISLNDAMLASAVIMQN